MKAVSKTPSKGAPVIYIDEYGKAFHAFYWGNLKLLGRDKPMGYNYAIVCDKAYLSISEYLDLFDKATGTLIDEDNILLLDDELALFPHTMFTERRITRRFAWIEKKRPHYERWASHQRYFSRDKISYNETRYFVSLRYGLEFYRLLYFLLYLSAKARSFSKVLGYPILFIGESLLTSFDSFIRYKRDGANLDDYLYRRNTYHFKYLAFRNEQYGALEKPLRDAVEKSRAVFFESGKFITTLIISIVTITIALVATIGRIHQLESQNSALTALQTAEAQTIQDLQLSLSQKDQAIHDLDLRIQQLQLDSKYVSMEDLKSLLQALKK